MRFVLSHQRGKDGKIFVEKRECSRVIEYKGLYFAACPNRVENNRPYSYDLLEVSTGLKVKSFPRLKECYPYVRDNFYIIAKAMKGDYCKGMVRDIMNFVEKNNPVDLIANMNDVFVALHEAGIIDGIII